MQSDGEASTGYMNLKDGAQTYQYSENYFSRLVIKSEATTVKVLRVVYFSVSGFEEFIQIPEGYELLDAAAEVSIFQRDTIRKLLGKGKVIGEKKLNMWCVNMESLRQYETAHEQRKNGRRTNGKTIDDVVDSSVI